MTRAVRAVAAGGAGVPIYGTNGNGRNCRVRFAREHSGLVLATYEQLSKNVHPIGSRWQFASVQRGKPTVAKCHALNTPIKRALKRG